VKFCPVITANKKQLNKAQNNHLRKEAEEKDKKKKVSKPKSGFAVLADSSDSEKEVKKVAKIVPKIAAKSDAKIANQLVVQSVIKMDEFPALSSTKIEVKPTVITGWAAITAKSAEQFQDEKMMQEIMKKSMKRMQPPIMKAKIVPQVKKNWADYTESDDYDEEEEEKYTQYKNPYDEEEEDW